MLEIAEVNPAMEHASSFVQTTVSRHVLDAALPLVEPNGRALASLLDHAVVSGIENAMSTLAERYAAEVLGAERSARSGGRQGYRSGKRTRTLTTPMGELTVSLVKTRGAVLVPPFLQKAGKFTQDVVALGRRLWVQGLSLRGVSAVASDALGGNVSHTEVGSWVHEAHDEVMRWLNRPIAENIRYVVFDGMYVSVKRENARKEALLIAVGITESGKAEVLDVLPAPSESLESWSTQMARLRGRGLKPSQLRLAISDGNEALIRAIESELPGVPRQRCTVHKVRNVIGKSPRALKAVAPKEASAIWKAPNKSEAKVRAAAFIERYRESQPALAAIIEDDLEATFAFFDLDANLWKTMRTTNVGERVNREMRRKFNDMGACKGDHAVTRTAALIAMKLSENWNKKIVEGFKKKPRRNARSAS
jgi:putative transposase